MRDPVLSEVQLIGPHRLLVGDLTAGAVGRLMGLTLADVIYSDPPWGPGNQQYWHTMNARGSAPRTDWPRFLAAFCWVCAAARSSDAPVLVEMGLRWADELDAAMLTAGLARHARWKITYGPRSKPMPHTLNLYGANVPGLGPRWKPDDPHGEAPTRAVLARVVRPGAVVLDPCTGLGMTARITHELGGRFFGCELNPGRMARTVAWLEKRVCP